MREIKYWETWRKKWRERSRDDCKKKWERLENKGWETKSSERNESEREMIVRKDEREEMIEEEIREKERW